MIGRSAGYRLCACKLTTEQENAIRAFSATGSLRSLSAVFGVSRETIRSVVRRSVEDRALVQEWERVRPSGNTDLPGSEVDAESLDKVFEVLGRDAIS